MGAYLNAALKYKKTYEFFALKPEILVPARDFLIPEVDSKRAGNNTRFVNVAVTRVRDVSQPKALVPPKPLKQKITKPAIRTRLV